MTGPASTPARSDLAGRVLAGEPRAIARLMRELDDARPGAVEVLRAIHPHTGRAFIVGITGNPGAGKSTVVDELITLWRARGKRVGVVAVDPTSPFSGGAILGDRIRMQRHALDEGVFIRSLATRGHLGGLSRATGDVVDVLDAAGFDLVLVETVGVGQDEVDVIRLADSTVVVTVPGLGDEVQAIKAGILEIADVLVVNKADREGADRAVRDLFGMLELRTGHQADVPIVKTVAARGEGIDELLAAVEGHRERERSSGRFAERRREQAAARVQAIVADRLRRALEARLAQAGPQLADEVAERRTDPYAAADSITAGLL